MNRDWPYILDSRDWVVAPNRNYAEVLDLRDWEIRLPERFYKYAIHVRKWLTAGQTDIHPFEPGGEDSTTPMGDLT